MQYVTETSAWHAKALTVTF